MGARGDAREGSARSPAGGGAHHLLAALLPRSGPVAAPRGPAVKLERAHVCRAGGMAQLALHVDQGRVSDASAALGVQPGQPRGHLVFREQRLVETVVGVVEQLRHVASRCNGARAPSGHGQRGRAAAPGGGAVVIAVFGGSGPTAAASSGRLDWARGGLEEGLGHRKHVCGEQARGGAAEVRLEPLVGDHGHDERAVPAEARRLVLREHPLKHLLQRKVALHRPQRAAVRIGGTLRGGEEPEVVRRRLQSRGRGLSRPGQRYRPAAALELQLRPRRAGHGPSPA
mmetsp:Transcript_10009/g.38939  ORF Transcript_10009/g.38939 Transcript_10009/m.38939 type:complete len:285 (-) Transcript_10009:242-1096(-)